MILADESTILTQIPRLFLDALQADANPRVHKAAGSSVWVQPSSTEKAGQVLQGEPPGRSASSAELLLRAGSGGRAPAGDSLWSCCSRCAAPPGALRGKLRLLGSRSASPRSAGFGMQTGLGSSEAAAVARRPVLPARTRHLRIASPGRSLQAPQSRNS